MKKQLPATSYQLSAKQSGQVVIILLMLMLVALSIGLAVTQKSITDVTTSTQTEQSSRAFSAAEAGIEKALTGGSQVQVGVPFQLGNDSTATVNGSALLPTTNIAIEYPAIGREVTAQFWLIDPREPNMAVAYVYPDTKFDLYFGNPQTTDKPAIEVKIIMFENGQFKTKVYYFDSESRANGFERVVCNSETLPVGILGDGHEFYCKKTVGDPVTIPNTGPPETACLSASGCKLILVRARFLYANENHKLAIAPAGSNPFPPQIQIYNATGISGQSEKQIQAFRVIDVIPPWFDFALFSINEIKK